MYIGSVKFFKHLILSIVVLSITVPSIGCISYMNAYNNLKSQETSEVTAFTKEPTSLDETLGHIQSYQSLYPELTVDKPNEYREVTDNTVFLTFDDGPSYNTIDILDTLAQHNIKATFFVVYKDDDFSTSIYKRIVNEGHTIGVHTTTHIYSSIYSSIDAYIEDFAKTAIQIEEVTGVKPDIFRFPGGSINVYNAPIYQQLISEMLRRGYTYYDWNVSGGDAASRVTSSTVYNSVVNSSKGKEKPIVLMHDSYSKSTTASALPSIIEYFKENGYIFEALDNSVEPIYFAYPE